MTWATILFAGWLTLAWLPNGRLELYDKPVPEYLSLTGSFYTELGAEATWGVLFAVGHALAALAVVLILYYVIRGLFSTGIGYDHRHNDREIGQLPHPSELYDKWKKAVERAFSWAK